MDIAISGASGFIGNYLTQFFQRQGYGVIPITRDVLKDRQILKQRLLGCEVVINLAGASINQRWSKKCKKELTDSRVGVTRALVDTVNELAVKPSLFISASAVGFYSSQGCHKEDVYERGEGFLAALCAIWEVESRGISPKVRVVNTRFGIVFSPFAGAFQKMISGTGWEVSVIPGDGKQMLSWIALEDLARGMEFLIRHPEMSGAVNFTVPNPITYREFSLMIAEYFSIVCTLKIPKFIFRLLLGEASLVLLKGQCALPDKLLRAGFVFKYPSLEAFLETQNHPNQYCG